MLLSFVVFVHFLTTVEALKCSAGFSFSDPESLTSQQPGAVGALMECANENAECVDMAASNDFGTQSNSETNAKKLHQSAVRASYLSDGHCQKDENFASTLNYYDCHCDWDACNTKDVAFPSVADKNATIDCYTGITINNENGYLAGGLEPCRGVCVKFEPLDVYKTLYGCVPVEVLDQVGADSFVTWKSANITFCSTSGCNPPPLPLVPDSGISCYTGFSSSDYNARNYTFYGALETCKPGELCAALNEFAETGLGTSDYYGCLNAYECASIIVYPGTSYPAEWQETGELWGSTCCLKDKCNYNEKLMGELTPPSQAEDKQVFNTFVGVHPRNQERSGNFRHCSGASAYVETNGRAFWMCLPSVEICTALNVTSGSCASNVTIFNKLCCIEGPIYPDETKCPLWGWQQGKTVANKCFTTLYSSNEHSDASDSCRRLHVNATLPSIGSAFENAELAEFKQDFTWSSIWLGLSPIANGTAWTWDDGTSFGYSNWALNEPAAGDANVVLDTGSRQWKSSYPYLANSVCQMWH